MVADAVTLDDRPTVAASIVATLAGAVTAVVMLPVFALSGLVAGVGAVVIATATRHGGRVQGHLGVAIVFVAVLLGALAGVSPPVILAATVLVVVAWDAVSHAHGLGRQIGRGAETIRAELAHTAGTLVGGAVAAGATLGVYLAIPGGWPLTALALVFLGAALLLIWLEA